MALLLQFMEDTQNDFNSIYSLSYRSLAQGGKLSVTYLIETQNSNNTQLNICDIFATLMLLCKSALQLDTFSSLFSIKMYGCGYKYPVVDLFIKSNVETRNSEYISIRMLVNFNK